MATGASICQACLFEQNEEKVSIDPYELQHGIVESYEIVEAPKEEASNEFAGGDALQPDKSKALAITSQPEKEGTHKVCSFLNVEDFVEVSITKQDVSNLKQRICKGSNFSRMNREKIGAPMIQRPSVVEKLTGVAQKCNPRVIKSTKKDSKEQLSELSHEDGKDQGDLTVTCIEIEDKVPDDESSITAVEVYDEAKSQRNKPRPTPRHNCMSPLNLVQRSHTSIAKLNPCDWNKSMYIFPKPDAQKSETGSECGLPKLPKRPQTTIPQLPEYGTDSNRTNHTKTKKSPLVRHRIELTKSLNSPRPEGRDLVVTPLTPDSRLIPLSATLFPHAQLYDKLVPKIPRGCPDNFMGYEETDEQLKSLSEGCKHLPAFKRFVLQRRLTTYRELRDEGKFYFPQRLPPFETEPKLIRKMKRDLLVVMRRHDQALFNKDYPPMIVPRYLQVLTKDGYPVCLGASSTSIVVQSQSQSTEHLYAVKYYRRGVRGVCDYLRDIIREAAVQYRANKLLPTMVPRVKGFVAIHDPTSTFLPCGLVTEFIPMAEGCLKSLSVGTAMQMQANHRSSLFHLDTWLGVTRQLIEAFEVLARNDITHNNVTPSNVLLTATRDTVRPVIIDFGHGLCWERDVSMARLPAALKSRLHPSHALPEVLAAHKHLAPELLTKRRVTKTSDVYSAGDIFIRLGDVLKLSTLIELGEEMREWQADIRMNWTMVQERMAEILQTLEDATKMCLPGVPGEYRRTTNTPVPAD